MVHLELHQQYCQHKALREYQRLYSTIQPSWQPNSLLTLHAAPIRPLLNTANGANRRPPPTERPLIYSSSENLRNQRLNGTQGVPTQRINQSQSQYYKLQVNPDPKRITQPRSLTVWPKQSQRYQINPEWYHRSMWRRQWLNQSRAHQPRRLPSYPCPAHLNLSPWWGHHWCLHQTQN